LSAMLKGKQSKICLRSCSRDVVNPEQAAMVANAVFQNFLPVCWGTCLKTLSI